MKINVRHLIVVGIFIAAFTAVLLWRQDPSVPVTTLTSVETLQRQFEQDNGTPRLVLLLSPT